MDDLQNNINNNSNPDSGNAINPDTPSQSSSSNTNPIGVNNNDVNSPVLEGSSYNNDNSQPPFDNGFSSLGNTSSGGSVGEQSINVADHFDVTENTVGITNNSDFNSESNSSFDPHQPENHQGEIPPSSNIVNQTSTVFNVGDHNTGNDLTSSPSNPNEALGSNINKSSLSDTVNNPQPVSVSNDPDINKPRIVTMAIIVCFLILIGLLILYFSIF